MALYRVLETSYINEQIVEPGQIVEYGGNAGPNLEPLEKGERPDQPVVLPPKD